MHLFRVYNLLERTVVAVLLLGLVKVQLTLVEKLSCLSGFTRLMVYGYVSDIRATVSLVKAYGY